jgi:hypothetical protein
VDGELLGHGHSYSFTGTSESPCIRMKSKVVCLGLSGRRSLQRCSGLWIQMNLYADTNVSEEGIVSIFRLSTNVGVYVQVRMTLEPRKTTSTKGEVVTGV